MTMLLWHVWSKIYILRKGKHIAFRKYHQDNLNNMNQLLFFIVMIHKYSGKLHLKRSSRQSQQYEPTAVFYCDDSQIFGQITFKKVGITVVGLYPRTLYKLYLHHITNTCSL